MLASGAARLCRIFIRPTWVSRTIAFRTTNMPVITAQAKRYRPRMAGTSPKRSTRRPATGANIPATTPTTYTQA